MARMLLSSVFIHIILFLISKLIACAWKPLIAVCKEAVSCVANNRSIALIVVCVRILSTPYNAC